MFVERLRTYPIEAIKVHLALPLIPDTDRSDPVAGLEEALRRVSFMASWGLPVHLYVPNDLMARIHHVLATNILHLGVERLYAFTRDLDQALVNSVTCFGRRLGRSRLLWVKRRIDQ